MRTIVVGLPELRRLASRGVVMIGDNIHAQPILGGLGANAAMKDGIELAEFIAEHGQDAIPQFYEARVDGWKAGVLASEEAVAKMHNQSMTHDQSTAAML